MEPGVAMGFHAATLIPFPLGVVIDKSISPLAKPMTRMIAGSALPRFAFIEPQLEFGRPPF
jgi:hypothetical protein